MKIKPPLNPNYSWSGLTQLQNKSKLIRQITDFHLLATNPANLQNQIDSS